VPDLLLELFSEEIPASPFARSAVTREDEQDFNGMRGGGGHNA
jgi:glycyl-tRNA synthetase beta subunit